MSRRAGVRAPAALGAVLAVAALAGCWQAPGAADVEASARPSVLVIVADDLARDVLGAYGGDEVATPALDALAREGALFRRALTASPNCTPARQAFLTGRWPHALGVTQVPTPLPAGTPTLATRFRAAGYRTAAIGKMHWHRAEDSDEDFGFDVVLDRPDWRAQLDAQERAAYEGWRASVAARDLAGRFNLAGRPVPLPEERMEAAWFVDRAAELLAADDRRPLLLFCSFYEPHAPFPFPAALAQAVRAEELALPADDLGALRDSVPGLWARHRAEGGRFGELSEDELRALAASYLRSVAWLDAQVGRLLAALDASGRADRTLVLFWSDHGFLLGEHGLHSKNHPFRGVVEVPLMLRGPGVPAGAREELVQTLDLFPTLCELAGVEPRGPLDGRSLVPLLERGAPVREAAYCEFAGQWAAVQTDAWKLVLGARASFGLDQLYDLRADPGERRNLVRDPAHRPQLEQLVATMQGFLAHSPPPWLPREQWLRGATPLAAVRAAIGRVEPGAGATAVEHDED